MADDEKVAFDMMISNIACRVSAWYVNGEIHGFVSVGNQSKKLSFEMKFDQNLKKSGASFSSVQQEL